MQIYEIARRAVDEGVLKNVATNVAKGVGNYAASTAKGVAKAPLNTAEYFANKILDTAGVPAAQQGTYSKYGHMAASQNKGTASIAKAENEIATEIAKEWARLGTVNNVKDETLDPRNIVQAANSLNTGKLQVNTDNIVATVKKMAPEYRRLQDLYTKDPAQAPAPPTTTSTGGTLTQTPTGQVHRAKANNPNAAVATPTTPAQTPAQTPAGFNYANVMKMPGMTTPVKKPVPAPAMAESLTWSKNFDPSYTLYQRMKLEKTQ